MVMFPLVLKGRDNDSLASVDVIGSSRCAVVSPFQGCVQGDDQPRAALAASPQDFPWAAMFRPFGVTHGDCQNHKRKAQAFKSWNGGSFLVSALSIASLVATRSLDASRRKQTWRRRAGCG